MNNGLWIRYEINSTLSSAHSWFIMPNCIRWLTWGMGVGLLLLATSSLLAEVVLDGTLGPATTLPGPRFDITAELGQQQGGNLFHSFKFFNYFINNFLTIYFICNI